MTAIVTHGDARDLPFPDDSIDLIVTSPPYFGLRSYTDGGQHYETQIGSEATPQEFIAALIACTREMARVLKPSGSIFVNLGDKYNSAASGQKGTGAIGMTGGRHDRMAGRGSVGRYAPPKCLLLLPERYRIACTDELGLIARAVIVWCLSGGAKVYARTSTGDRPVMLRDLVRSYRTEDVQLWNGERWTQVLGWGRTPDDEGALEFELRTGERIGCTPGHQWPTTRGLLRADEVRVGDVIETTRLPEPDAPRTPALLPDDDIGWLVGLYLAEGSRSETTVQIAGHVNETGRHARLARIAAALDATSAVYQTSENGVTCNLRGSVLVGVLDRYVSVGTAGTKRLRHAAWQRSDAFLAAVVDGYLSGDGHYDAKNDRWRLGFTKNDEWAADLRTLAARLGTVLRLRRAQHRYDGRTFPGWRGEWRWTRSTHHNATEDGEVVAIRRSRARDFYDLSVADDPHLFALASGVLTHNCKPNGLPESVRDRVRRSHEDWVHLTKSPRYFEAVDEIREPHSPTAVRNKSMVESPRHAAALGGGKQTGLRATNAVGAELNPLGKLPGSVWSIATQPLRVPAELNVNHFAAFPMEWPRRLITGWCPREVCTACGEGRRPATEIGELGPSRAGDRALGGTGTPYGGRQDTTGENYIRMSSGNWFAKRERTITGYACACPDTSAPSTPGTVLDPFGGTGTTALVADVLGRTGISLDASADYGRIAQWRTTDRKQRERAGQAKPSKDLPLIGPVAEPVAEPDVDPFDELLAAVFAAPSLEALDVLRTSPTWAQEHEALSTLRAHELTHANDLTPEDVVA